MCLEIVALYKIYIFVQEWLWYFHLWRFGKWACKHDRYILDSCISAPGREMVIILPVNSVTVSALGLWLISVKELCIENFCFFKDFISLFLDRGEGRQKERKRNINVWLPLMHLPPGTWPAIQACAWLGIEPATLWFSGQHSIHWDTPAMVDS